MIVTKTFKDLAYGSYISSEQAGNNGEDQIQRSPYINYVIRAHIPTDFQLRILDLGCGHGSFLYTLKQFGYRNIAGVDTSLEQVQLANKLGVTEVEHGEIANFLKKQAELSADVVLLIDVLEHLTRQELFDTLAEVFKTLKSGGKCIVHVPNAEGLYGMRIRYGDITHELSFTPKSVHQIFSIIGFGEIECIEDKPIIHGLKSLIRRITWSIGTLVPRLLLAAETGSQSFILSQNMLIICKKR